MLAKETTVNYVLEEQRIENAFQARESCDEDRFMGVITIGIMYLVH